MYCLNTICYPVVEKLTMALEMQKEAVSMFGFIDAFLASSWMADLVPKWVRLAPNGTNQGFFFRSDSVSQNVLNLI